MGLLLPPFSFVPLVVAPMNILFFHYCFFTNVLLAVFGIALANVEAVGIYLHLTKNAPMAMRKL
jgi:hypothetical protein